MRGSQWPVVSGIFENILLNDINQGTFAAQAQLMTFANANDTRQRLVGVISLCGYVVTGILLLRWIYRANFNVRQLGAVEMKFTPGWSIGWYFISIANFWKPYQAMKEIWKASKEPANWQHQSVSSLLPWWWVFWLASAFIGQLSSRLLLLAQDVDDYIGINRFSILADALNIPLILILLAIIGRVYEMQMSYFRGFSLDRSGRI